MKIRRRQLTKILWIWIQLASHLFLIKTFQPLLINRQTQQISLYNTNKILCKEAHNLICLELQAYQDFRMLSLVLSPSPQQTLRCLLLISFSQPATTSTFLTFSPSSSDPCLKNNSNPMAEWIITKIKLKTVNKILTRRL